MEDALAIDKALAHASKAIIVGAGLIGLELAEALSERGLTVTVVEALPHILANTLDDDLCALVAQAVPATVTLLPYHFVTKVATGKGTLSVSVLNRETHAEQNLEADIVVLATGTRPEVSVAAAIGCRIGVTGGVEVDARSETSIPDVYAAGDCTEYRELVTGEPVCIGLGSIAVRQGIAAGINAAGGSYELPAGVLLSRTSSVFGLEFAAVGPLLVHKHPRPMVHGKFAGSSRPTYFPGGVPITVKVGVEEESGRIVSAQAVGDQAAQRMNVYACAILKNMTVGEMQKLETTYAPPVAPTLDALTLACDVAALKRARKKR
jgi:NADPH-dependent 2,4-dienoyl-CoA reductase/sulfur reductase-like enzyme